MKSLVRQIMIAKTLLLAVGILLVQGCGGSSPDTDATSKTSNRPAAASNGSAGTSEDAPATNTGRASRSPSTPSLAAVRFAFEEGREADALRLARAFLLANPNHPEALFIAAQGLFAAKESTEAIDTLNLIPADDPDFGLSALGQIADWKLQSGDPSEAEAAFRKIVDTHGDIPLAHSRIAMLQNSQGKRFESSQHLMKLASLQDITLRELGALMTISDQCAVEKIQGTTGTDADPVEGDLRRARQMGMVEKWEESLALTEKLRARFPDSAPIAAFLGTLYITLQKADALKEWARSLPPGMEEQPEYWATLARWLELQGRNEDALRCASESLLRDSTNHVMYETLARLLKAAGHDESADLAMQRSQTLSKVRKRYQQTFTGEPTANDYGEIGLDLLRLHRPWEALGWLKQAMKLGAKDQSIDDLQAKLKSYSAPADQASWVLCGVDLDEFPLSSSLRDALGSENTVAAESNSGPIELVDVAEGAGLAFQYDPGNRATDGSYLLHHTMGGGIGVLDYDRDGWPDLYLSQGGGDAFEENNAENRLFRNLAGDSFTDVGEQTSTTDKHYGQGVTAADLNQDGFVDLIVANIGPNIYYRNNGDGTFEPVELAPWIGKDHWTSSVACGDLDGDALLDLVECNYIDDEKAMTIRCTKTEQHCKPAAFQPSKDRVLFGKPDGTFAVREEANAMENDASYSLGVIIAQMDGKPGNELFIANDTEENALWFRGVDPESGEVKYTQEARLRGCATGPSGKLLGCMGIATGDFDRSGTLDLYVTNYFNEASNLFLQQDAGLFVDSVALYGGRQSSMPMVGFGTQAIDLQRDGWLDTVVLNGHAVDRRSLGEPLQMLPQVYRGQKGAMIEVSIDQAYWQTPALGRTLAVLDWNRDGRPDLVANHLDRPLALLENQSSVANWIQFDLVGTESDRDAVGAIVTIEANGESWVSWVTGGDGYFCSNEPFVDFGLPNATSVDRVTIQWPSGQTESIQSLEADRRYLIVEGDGQAFERK